MSVFQEEMVTCPHCGAARTQRVAHSVNAARSPHLREQVLAGTFQRQSCEECGGWFEIGHPFLYVDLPRRQWFCVFHGDHEIAWRALEGSVISTHEQAAGSGAPAIARRLGEEALVRAVFGLDALREKLVCLEAGLDDVVLEVLKFHLGLCPNGTLLSEEHHLRLIEAGAEELGFVAGGPAGAALRRVPRAVYEEVAAAPTEWAPVRAAVSAGPYVDLGRIAVAGDAAPP